MGKPILSLSFYDVDILGTGIRNVLLKSLYDVSHEGETFVAVRDVKVEVNGKELKLVLWNFSEYATNSIFYNISMLIGKYIKSLSYYPYLHDHVVNIVFYELEAVVADSTGLKETLRRCRIGSLSAPIILVLTFTEDQCTFEGLSMELIFYKRIILMLKT
jgi:hypothetical protein